MRVKVVGYWGGYPAVDEATSAYVVEKDNFLLVIDMGSAALSKIQKYYSVDEIDAVILSHYHHDHMADIGVLQYARLVQMYLTDNNTVLPIYGHTEDEKFESLTHDVTKGIAYNPNKELEIGPFTISFLRTKHPVPCFGMRVTDGESTFVYTADTAYQDEWIEFAKDVDLLITDCNFYADQDGEGAGHMTSAEGGWIAAESKVKKLILSHLPQYGNQQDLIKEAREHYLGPIELAREGLVWDSKK